MRQWKRIELADAAKIAFTVALAQEMLAEDSRRCHSISAAILRSPATDPEISVKCAGGARWL